MFVAETPPQNKRKCLPKQSKSQPHLKCEKVKVTQNVIIVKQDLRNLTAKASSLQNHIKGRPTKLLIMYEAFLHAIWAPCVWHECVCVVCV